MKQKILYISQKRNDAIWKTDENQKKFLQKNNENPFDFLEIFPKWEKKLEIFKNYLKNIFLILFKSFSYKKIYFSYENPYVIFVKICFPFKNITMCVHHLESWANTILWKIILKIPDKIVAISHFTKNQIQEKWIAENKIFVNYNGVSEEFFAEKIENFYDKKYILYVGTELPRKNLGNLFLAFEKISKKFGEIFLVKIGNSWGKNSENLTEKILEKHKNIREKIIFLRENLSNSELRKWYSNAEIYISVSKLEGFWLTIPEAMACQTAIVASDIWPFREIVQNENFLVNPENPEEIAKKIEKILQNKNFREKNIENGILQSQKFSWQKNSENLINLLK